MPHACRYAEFKQRASDSQLFKLQSRIQDQEIEIKRLRSQTVKSSEPAFIEIRNLKDELIQLEQQNMAAKRDVERAEEALDSERSVVAQLTVNLKDEKARATVLQDTNRRLEEELRDTRNQLSDQRTRMQSRNIDQDQIKLQLNERNAELNRYVAEIQMLSTENAQMAAEMELLTQELEVTVNEFETNAKELQDTKDRLDQSQLKIEELEDECDALKIKIEDLVEQLDSREQSQESLNDELQTETNALKEHVAEQSKTVEHQRKTIQHLQSEIEALQHRNDQTLLTELKDELINKGRLHLNILHSKTAQRCYILIMLTYFHDIGPAATAKQRRQSANSDSC
eukprot:jgi/Hompol1/5931/HPOL_000996-RA